MKLLLLLAFIVAIALYISFSSDTPPLPENAPSPVLLASPSPQPSVSPAPIAFEIPLRTHVFQTFNNCGPASLSMLLSYFDISASQAQLGAKLRPYQNRQGDNDDKSVTLAELAHAAQSFGLLAYHRPNGTSERIKKAIAAGYPVLVRTWLKVDDDIGHYRLIRGYDDRTQEFIQDDSYQNKNLRFSYSDFDKLWQAFNYEYLIVLPAGQESLAAEILGNEIDERVAWQHAVTAIEADFAKDSQNIYHPFNLSVAHFHLGNYGKSVAYFEMVEHRLPFRMLWYQIEPIEAYMKLGKYARVIEISDRILNNHNRAFSELYLLRGEIYKAQGNIAGAREEFEKAVLYNQNLGSAQQALSSMKN